MPSPNISIVFFGNEKLATGIATAQPVIRNALERAGFQIETVVTEHNVPAHQARLAVLAAYGKILPQSVLEQFPLGIINVHPSLLPVYRGPTPIETAILDGATKTGVSIMRLTPKMDAGPVYKQKTVRLRGDESKAKLAQNLQLLGAKLLIEVLPGIVAGTLQPRAQPHPDRATYCKLIKKSDGIIDWTKSAIQIEREIRAFSEWPKSRTELLGKEVAITKAKVVIPATGQPGSISRDGKKLVMVCGQSGLSIERLKPANRREMSAAEFLAGLKD